MGKQEQEEGFEVSMDEVESSGTIPAGSSPDDFRILEAVLFASDELLTAPHLKMILPGQPDARKIRAMVEKINVQLQKERHPFEVVEIGGGYQFRTITYYHPWVRQIFKEKASKKLSIQALECLAIIAYKQPISKAEIEAVRGVVSDGAMKTLLEKRLVTVSGRSDKPGRPLLYGTTQTFLTYFGLNKIEDLPRIEEFEAMAREKMEELSLDELAAPEPVSDEESDAQAARGITTAGTAEGAAKPPETPVESSVFEVEITPAEPAKEPPASPEVVNVKDGATDDDADFEVADAAKTPVEAPLDAVENEAAFEIDNESPVKAGEPVAQAAAAVEQKEEPVAPKGDAPHAAPPSIEGEALRGETAFDLESIIIDESTVPAPQPGNANNNRKSELEGIVLRGETAFDLEAIVIEEPQINFPSAATGKSGAGTPQKKATVNETAFDIDLMPKATPKPNVKQAAEAETLPAADVAKVKNDAAFDLESTIETIDPPSATTSAASDEEARFKLNGPVAAATATTMTDADGEDDALFEPKAAAATTPVKIPDTAYFEVGESSALSEAAAEASDRLAEELKETVIILPDGTRKNASGTSANQARKTGSNKNTGRKKDADASDGKIASVKKSRPRSGDPEQSDNS